MKSNNFVCPLKWFNTRLIGFWSFTNRFSESKFSVGSVHTANSFTHHHSLIARPNNDPKLRFWVTLEGEREEREWETGAMCFTKQFIALCLAPKWQNTLEKVMPVHNVQMNWDSLCSIHMRASDCRIRLQYLLWKIVSREMRRQPQSNNINFEHT